MKLLMFRSPARSLDIRGVQMTRRHLRDIVRDALRRRKIAEDKPRTRVVTPHWRRTHEIVHPETDLSQWVHKVAERDWDNVKRGRNRD